MTTDNHLCCCTGVSTSKLELAKHQVVLNSCKICGGKPLVHGQGALPRNMLSNSGIELSSVIDPQLNWKTASRGKSRAIRRARTSFLSMTKNKSARNGLKQSENIINKESGTKDISVSESEKLGVTILGRHFSDTVASVPIKKRRFLFQSPPPLRLPSFKDVSEHVEVSQIISCGNGTEQNSKDRHEKLDTTAHVRGKGKRNVADDKCDLNDTVEELCEMADFSGISILAAAACSSASDDVMICESLVSKGDSSRIDRPLGIPESCSGNENKIIEERQLDTADVTLVGTATLYCKEEAYRKMTGEESSSSLPSVPDETTGNLVRMGPSLRDDRFYWDLNTVMDKWESPCDGAIADSQPVASHAVVEGSSHHGGMLGKQESYDVEGDSMSTVKIMDNKVDYGRLSADDNGRTCLTKSDLSCNISVAHLEDHSALEQKDNCCAPVAIAEHIEETNTLNDKKASSFMMEFVSFPAEHVPDPLSKCLSANSCASEEEEAKIHGTSVAVEIEAGKNLRPIEYSSTEHSILISEPYSAPDKRSNETATGEKTSAESEAVLHMHSDDCCLGDAQVSTTMQMREQVFLCADQDTCKINECYRGPTADPVADFMVCGDVCKLVSDRETHGDDDQTDHLNGTSDINNQSTEAGKCARLPESFSLVSYGLSDHEETTSGFMSKDELMNQEKARFQGSRSMLTCPDEGHTKSDHHGNTRTKDLMVQCIVDECAVMDASHKTQNGYSDNLVKGDLENASKDHFNCDCYSDTSKNEEAVQMDIDHEGDNNCQYEDGEFIESFAQGWGMDEGDDFEAEHVDYGPDDKETDAFEAASDYPTVGSFECENKGLLENGCGGNHDEEQETVSSQLPTSVKGVSGIDTAEGADGAMLKALRSRPSGGKGMKKLGKNMKDATESSALTGMVMQDGEFVSKGDRGRELCHFASLRKKSSGWDQFPDGVRNLADIAIDSGADSSEINHDNIPSSGCGAGESLKASGLTFRRKLLSQIERPKFYDISQRKERAYFSCSRNRNHSNDLHHNDEKDVKLRRSDGREGSSAKMHHKSSGDNWFKSSSHSGPRYQDSASYCTAANFTHLGAKDAAAVSIAKVVSNGFVVAPDGTVVEAAGVGPSSHLPRRSADSSLRGIRHSRRGSPIERDEMASFDREYNVGPTRQMSPGRHVSSCRGRSGRFGHRMVSAERYYRFIPDNNIRSSLPMRRPFSRGELSFSPQRRPVQESKSYVRSHSRSRTRSPHVWASVQRTRSPSNFRSEVRFERIKSPRRSGSVEGRADFVPSSRNCASPRHASRWMGERKILTGPHRDQECRSPKRCTPARPLSQSRRFDPVDSPETLKQDKFYRPMHSSRFLELGVDKGSRLDGIDGDRRHGDRYEMFPSGRQFNVLGDADDVFAPRKDSAEGAREFHGRETPRSYHRREASQHRSSPPRANVVKVHFGYGRDEEQNRSLKSCRTKGCDGDSSTQSRQPS